MKRNNYRTNFGFATFTAILCALVALVSCISFFTSDPFWMIDELKITKAEVKDTTAKLDRLTEQLDEAQAQYDTIYEQNKAELTKLETALKSANKELNKVCDQESYTVYNWTSWYGYYSYGPCYNNGCEALHKAVDTAQKNSDDFKTKIKLSSYEKKIDQYKEDIPDTEEKLANLTDELKTLTVSLISSALRTCALLLCCVALACLFIFLGIKKQGKFAILSVIIMMIGSILFLLEEHIIVPLLTGKAITIKGLLAILASPYLWSIVIMTMFVVILAKKQGKLVKFRVIAIISSIIMQLLSFATATLYAEKIIEFITIFTLYAVTMLLVSFVLVPIDYTGYISIAKHIFLSIITLGIWLLVWAYNVTKQLDEVSAEYRKPAKELLLYMFLPLYNVYWTFKTADCVEEYGLANNKQYKISTLCLVFAMMCPLLSTILIQDKLNLIVGKPDNCTVNEIDDLAQADTPCQKNI